MSNDLAISFKKALRGIAATVAVITARSEAKSDGMTATAVTSLCVNPPSLLACVNRQSALSSTMHESTGFCVNFLCSDQECVSRAFSDPSRRHERFQTGNWIMDDTGPPYLIDAQANIFCRRESAILVQTHTLFLGRVSEVRCRNKIAPLVYLNGIYSSVIHDQR